jgi:phage-related protein
MSIDLSAQLDAMTISANGIKGQMDALTKTSADSCGVLGTLAATMGGAIKDAAKAIEGAVKGALEAMGKLSSFVSGIIGKITGVFKQLASKIASLSAGLIAKLTSIITSIKNGLSGIVSGVTSLVGTLTSKIKDLAMSAFSGAFDLIKGVGCKNTTDALANIGAGASSAADQLKSSLASAAPGLASQKALTDQLGSAVNEKLDLAKGAVSGLQGAIESQTKAVTAKLNSSIKQITTIAS